MKTIFLCLLSFLSIGPVVLANPTIDRMTLGPWFFNPTYSPNQLYLPQHALWYYLNDGSSWESGAGTGYNVPAVYQSTTISNGFLLYHFAPFSNGILFRNTDYGFGATHSAQGTLGFDGELVLVAQPGSTTARLSGATTILDNSSTIYPDVFNYYSAAVGQSVYFQMDFTITSGTWQVNTFQGNFNYTASGFVDFTHVVPEPDTVALFGAGVGLLSVMQQRARRSSRQ